jgi:hypothetical protein
MTVEAAVTSVCVPLTEVLMVALPLVTVDAVERELRFDGVVWLSEVTRETVPPEAEEAKEADDDAVMVGVAGA